MHIPLILTCNKALENSVTTGLGLTFCSGEHTAGLETDVHSSSILTAKREAVAFPLYFFFKV